MPTIVFSDIALLLKVVPLQQYNNPSVDYLLTDSRKLLFPEQTLFFTINNQQKSANSYINNLYQQGVRSFIVDKTFDVKELKNYPEANIIQVDNCITALQKITEDHRGNFSYPVIGITGSNGKTIVKEWLYQLLNNDYSIVRSPKSYNSQVGVPLSVWQMKQTDSLGIFEAGISLPGEMEQLEKVIKPTIGIITFIGEAHAEGFSGIQQKTGEKLKLFADSKILIYCADDRELNAAVKSFKKNTKPSLELFTWGKGEENVLRINKIEKQSIKTIIHCLYATESFDFSIPFADDASINNAITCCCLLLHLRFSISDIVQKMQYLKPVEMRLELKQGINNCSIINDSYNADIDSLAVALDFLQQQQQHEKRTLILSDVLQSGLDDEQLYKKIVGILSNKSLSRFIGIGENLFKNKNLFDQFPERYFFLSTEDFLKQFSSLHFKDETILLKGARVFAFEKISKLLEQKMHQTLLEVNLNAIRHNLKIYQQQLKPGVKLMAMVKAFSYGSGSFEISNVLQHAGIDYLGVAYADEGVELRKAGIRVPVMVMNTEEAGFASIVKYNLEPVLYSFRILNTFKDYCTQNEIIDFKVHLKLDTGMHRLGFEEADMEKLCNEIAGINECKIQSVFSHLVASDEKVHDDFTKMQAELFIKMSDQIENKIGYAFIKHLGNSGAIYRHPALQFDMMRLGIGLYGVASDPAIQQRLKNVTTLKTTISQIKYVKKGDTIGYSRKGIAEKDSVIATVRLGYADGYSRAFGNGCGKMMLNEKLAPVIGNVSMDMTMIDITGIDAKEEDEVIVFGEKLPVSILAAWANSIAYEMLTNISQRVKRVYFEE
jgi:alanine racemase